MKMRTIIVLLTISFEHFKKLAKVFNKLSQKAIKTHGTHSIRADSETLDQILRHVYYTKIYRCS